MNVVGRSSIEREYVYRINVNVHAATFRLTLTDVFEMLVS